MFPEILLLPLILVITLMAGLLLALLGLWVESAL